MVEAHYPDLLRGGWQSQLFEPFREGVSIAWLYRPGPGEPGVALLKYAPGARIPRHRHPGLETILVLEGVQSDEHGAYAAGTVMLNRPGTSHSVWSEPGCVVLIQWDVPVEFVDEQQQDAGERIPR